MGAAGGTGGGLSASSLPSTHVCQTCMGVFELRGFHLDDRVRKNVALVSLQSVPVGMNTKSFLEPGSFRSNAGVVVTWGWTVFLVVVEAGLALTHQDILKEPLHSHDWPNILRRRAVVDAVFMMTRSWPWTNFAAVHLSLRMPSLLPTSEKDFFS